MQYFFSLHSLLHPPRLVMVCVSLLFATACFPSGSPDDTGAQSHAIVDGVRETGEEAVVLVYSYGGGGRCTGTLITPRVVLTAKHCVQQESAERPTPAALMGVGVGYSARSVREYRVSYVDATPGAYGSSPAGGLTGAFLGLDVGVIVLRDPVEGVTPIPIRRDRPDDMVDQTFTAVGFGLRPDGGSGEKYRGEGTVTAVTNNGIIYTANTICSGDSGGPMIQEGPERQVIGVASFGVRDSCPSPQDGYNGIWNQLDMIDRAIALSGGCVDRGTEICDSIDNDCDGEIDEGCAGMGEACAADTDCAYAQLPEYLSPLDNPVSCQMVGESQVCTRACNPLSPENECLSLPGFNDATVSLSNLYCRRTEDCDGRCVQGDTGMGANGSSCMQDTDCASLYCGDPGNGELQCLDLCRGDDASCAANEACTGSPGSCGGCFDNTLYLNTRGLGESCSTNEDCYSGTCFVDGETSYCSQACEEDPECPSTMHCADMTCQRGSRAAFGTPCAGNEDCDEGLFCAFLLEEGWCTRFCENTEGCESEGFECVAAGGAMLCAPEGALLGRSCTADTDCVTGQCAHDRCVQACDANNPCPMNFECIRDESGAQICLPPAYDLSEPVVEEGGCQVHAGAGSMPTATLIWLSALGMAVLYRRRRRTV